MKLRFLIPLGLFLGLAVFLALGLSLDPSKVPSPLVGKPVPQFSLPTLDDPQRSLGPEDLKGQAYLLNVWASWCVACRDEHPLLVRLAADDVVPIYGLNYKDESPDARRWLANLGDPYTESLVDYKGRAGLDLGVYGVPETFVVDAEGVIRHKFIGPVTKKQVDETLMPLLAKLRAEG